MTEVGWSSNSVASIQEQQCSWPLIPLGELCSISAGGTPRRSQPECFGGGIPWVKIGDLTNDFVLQTEETLTDEGIANSSAKIFPIGTVLISIFATIGRTSILGIEAATNQAIAGITPKNESQLLPEYLKYALDSKHAWLNRQARGVAQPNINSKILKSLLVPLPPIEEQRRIVDILKRADSIRLLRKQAIDSARQLIPALFIDMFGDPATNPKGWPMRKVSDFVKKFEGGKNLKAGSDLPGHYRILKVSAVTSGVYIESESKPAPDDYLPPEQHFVREGDLLFSRANTEALIGATALVEKTNGRTLLPDKLWRFVWAEEVEPTYIHALFQTPHVRRELSKLSSGTSASMRNISQAKLKDLTLPIAPLPEQKIFADHVRQAQSIIRQQSTALDISRCAFESLLTKLFSPVA
ncbi:MAG TPA: restriction endonuclease subunit S [Gammaproteobacteria bacterium]|nr:restriction endonuclease subunit S [Gammaproteobacteria bacterium]